MSDDDLVWGEIQKNIDSGQTSWIYTLNKVQLSQVCKKLDIKVDESTKFEDIRKAVAAHFKQRKPVGQQAEQTIAATDYSQVASMASILTPVEPFKKGANWETFEEQLDAFILLSDVSEAKQTPLLLTRLSPEVFEELRTLCEPQKPLSMTYNELKGKLKELCEPQQGEHLQRYTFRERKQKEGESIQDFVMALRAQAKLCKFTTAETDSRVKDQLISGVGNDLIRYELLKSSASSLKDLVSLAKTVEAASVFNQEGTSKIRLPGTSSVEQQQQQQQQHKHEAEVHAFRGEERRGSWRRNTRGRGKPASPAASGNDRKTSTTTQANRCFCCGKTNHLKAQCTLRNKFCSECGQRGHIYRMCERRIGNSGTQNFVDSSFGETSEIEDEVNADNRFVTDFFFIRPEKSNTINTVILDENDNEFKEKIVEPQFEMIRVNGIPLKMEIDSGAAFSAISEECYKRHFSQTSISPAKRQLFSYNKTLIKAIGYITVVIEANHARDKCIVYVVRGGGRPLIGRNWLCALGMWPIRANPHKKRAVIGQVNETIDKLTITASLREEFPNVFAPGLGTFTKSELELIVKDGTQPKFVQPRRVPLAMRVLVENEIERLKNCKIIEPVEYSDWGTPVVPVLKKDGTVRLCGDYKTTLNKHLQIDHFPLPRVEEVLDTLRGGVLFTKLDLAEAYQQVPLREESKKLVVISTHVGLFRYNRLPYGVATGPGSFQRIMTSLLLGIPGVMVFLDAILIAAPDYEKHGSRVREVLRRLNDSGLRLKDQKCKFMQKEIKYLGFRVNAAGIFPSGEKIESVKQAPEPKNVTELKSFLGSITYYARFIGDITDKLQPLYECLKKGKFEWTEKCTQSFESIKTDLSSELMLAHFDPAKPIVLTCDASPYGVSAVLAHRDNEGGDRPVCFASRTLSGSEKGYPHHDKEGLAVIFGIQKFYQYLFGNQFLIQTDSTALSRIFHPDRSIPEISTARLQRWAIFLSAFRYDIKHIRGDKNYADWLSRLPVKEKETVAEFAILQDSECSFLQNIQASDFATLDWKKVQSDTRKDVTLCKIIRYCVDGWPGEAPEDKEIIPFWEKREALSVENNCVLWGHRIIIPAKLRNLVLHELHHSHFGASRMKALARSYVWWPKLDQDIEMITRQCVTCLKLRKNPPKVPLTPWPWPLAPWHRIHADFLGPLFGKMVLAVIDSHSKWPEIFVVPNMREETVIAIFEQMFSQFGYPAHIVTDNFSSFTGDKFQTMIKKNSIRHSTSPPHCPATNGAAENLVDTIKRKIKAMVEGGKSLDSAVRQFLFDYRSSPHPTTQRTPASLMLGREIRNRFSVLRPPPVISRVESQHEREVRNHLGSRKVMFKIGDSVMAKDYRGGGENWALAKITKEVVAGTTYEINTADGLRWKRHANQLIACEDEARALAKPQLEREKEDVPVEPRRSARLRAKQQSSD